MKYFLSILCLFVLSCDSDSPTAPVFTGCTDESACNYDTLADEDDGTCTYAEENLDCDSNCIVDVDCNNECGGDALVDECGVCNGSGIADGACDCDGNVNDECGVCDGDGLSCMDIVTFSLDNYIESLEENPNEGSVDILFDFEAMVKGFQFDLNGAILKEFNVPFQWGNSSSPYFRIFNRLNLEYGSTGCDINGDDLINIEDAWIVLEEDIDSSDLSSCNFEASNPTSIDMAYEIINYIVEEGGGNTIIGSVLPGGYTYANYNGIPAYSGLLQTINFENEDIGLLQLSIGEGTVIGVFGNVFNVDIDTTPINCDANVEDCNGE